MFLLSIDISDTCDCQLSEVSVGNCEVVIIGYVNCHIVYLALWYLLHLDCSVSCYWECPFKCLFKHRCKVQTEMKQCMFKCRCPHRNTCTFALVPLSCFKYGQLTGIHKEILEQGHVGKLWLATTSERWVFAAKSFL